MPRNGEDEHDFRPLDTINPAADWQRFKRDFLAHLESQTDESGTSSADHVLDLDMGGGAAGAPAIPAGAGNAKFLRLRSNRAKKSYALLYRHVVDQSFRQVITDLHRGQGRAAYLYAETLFDRAITQAILYKMQSDWALLSIVRDIGIAPDSITKFAILLERKNQDLPIGSRYDQTQVAEKMLLSIIEASAHFQEGAMNELNAVPGQRSFEQPPPPAVPAPPAIIPPGLVAAPPAIRHRDLTAMMNHYKELWRAACVPGGALTVAPPRGAPRAQLGSEQANSARAGSSAFSFSAPASVEALRCSGFECFRGCHTTSNFCNIAEEELAEAVENGSTDQFTLEECYDADDRQMADFLCDNCRGVAHKKIDCPSPAKFRSLSYVGQLIANAKDRADARSSAQGNPRQGRQVPPRGQRPPFKKGMPRSFNAPVRRPPPAHWSPRTRTPRARANEAVDESEEDEDDGEKASTLREDGAKVPAREDAAKAAESTEEHGKASPKMPTEFVLGEDDYFDEPEIVNGAVDKKQYVNLAGSLLHAASDHGNDVRFLSGMATTNAEAESSAPVGLSVADDRDEVIVWDISRKVPRTPVEYELTAPLNGEADSGRVWIWNHIRLIASAVVASIACICMCVLTGAAEYLTMFVVGFNRLCDALEAMSQAVGHAPMIAVIFLIIIGRANGLTASHERAYGLIEDDGLWGPADERVTDEYAFTAVPVPGMRAAVGNATMHRILGTEGLSGCLYSVRAGKTRDGIRTYFNDDNEVGIDDALRLPDGVYVKFLPGRKQHEIVTTNGITMCVDSGATSTACPSSLESKMSRIVERPQNLKVYVADGVGLPVRWIGELDAAFDGFTFAEQANATNGKPGSLTSEEVHERHAALGHFGSRKMSQTNAVFNGKPLSAIGKTWPDPHDLANCRGCRIGGALHTRSRKLTAPSVKKPLESSPPFTHFGQLVETDLCVSFPPSFPHHFTAMMNFVDRYTTETQLYFLCGTVAAEVGGALSAYRHLNRARLREGNIGAWRTDNDTRFDGEDVRNVVREFINREEKSIPNLKNTSSRSERSWGIIERSVKSALAHAENADDCLWPWAAHQASWIMYYLGSRPLDGKSPYEMAYPNAPPADLSWAKPMFCDVSVTLPERDVDGKLSHTGADGFYLGRDHKRAGEFCYLPALRRLGTFRVDKWRPKEFTQCKGITKDTPCNYHQQFDLPYSEATGESMPKYFHAPRAAAAHAGQKQEGDNVSPVSEGDSASPAMDLRNRGERRQAARQAAKQLHRVQKEEGEEALSLAQGDAREAARLLEFARGVSSLGEAKSVIEYEVARLMSESGEVTFMAEVDGVYVVIDSIRRVSEVGSIPTPKSLAEAMGMEQWPMFKEAMEEEIAGKLSNRAFEVVRRPKNKHVMKGKWVFTIKYNDDGSIKRVKARFVACGYSQIEGTEYKQTHASTLPAVSLRVFLVFIVAMMWKTDQIDAVKAFTQADVDCELFCEMPEGFTKGCEGFVLLLLKALEGIKQGAYLWAQLNRKVLKELGFESSLNEPNLYRHKTLKVRAGVFADDVLAAYAPDAEGEYLLLRAEYGKRIKIDSSVPRPMTKFTGVQFEHETGTKKARLHQEQYFDQLATLYKGRFDLKTTPVGKSKADREKFEKMEPGKEDDEMCDQTEYLSLLGALLYPSVMTRMDLAPYLVTLCSAMNKATTTHFGYALHLLGYAINTKKFGLMIDANDIKKPMGVDSVDENFYLSFGLHVYSDSSWGKVPKPLGGYAIIMAMIAVDWCAKLLKIVADSSCEAETATGSRATKAIMFVREIASFLGIPIKGPTLMMIDNEAMLKLCSKDGATARTRYFIRATTFVKDAAQKCIIKLVLVPTDLEIADLFTKALDQGTFEKMRDYLFNHGVTFKTKEMGLKAEKMVMKLNSILSMFDKVRVTGDSPH